MCEYLDQAKGFLDKTNSKIDIKFNRFGTMPWDQDNERNIFDITLTCGSNFYNFEFGSSLVDSCKETPKIYSKEKLVIYTGFSIGKDTDSFIAFSFKIETSYPDLLAIYNEEMQVSDLYKDDRLEAEINEKVEDYQKHLDKLLKSRKIYDREARAKMYTFKTQFGFLRMKESVDRKINSAIDKALKETCLIDQKDEIIEPNEYDVLSCLSVSYIEDLEDFISNFGYSMCTREERERTQSTFEAVKDQEDHLIDMYTEEEIQLLNDIC